MEAKKILLVEDDPNFGAVLKDYLMINDFEVTLAKNGMEGFEKFKKDTYDLCILDVMMPYKDGYTLAREIREKNQEVPIIFLTAKSMKEDMIKGYKIGADDYLTKPFDEEELVSAIESRLAKASLLAKLAEKNSQMQADDDMDNLRSLNELKNFFHRPRNNSSLRISNIILKTFHGMCFSCSGLSISQYSGIVTL